MVIRSLVAALLVTQLVSAKTIAESTQTYVVKESRKVFRDAVPVTYGFAVEDKLKNSSLISKDMAWAATGALLYSAIFGLAGHDYSVAYTGNALSRLGDERHGLCHARNVFTMYLATVVAARLVRHMNNKWNDDARRKASRQFSFLGIQPARAS